MIVLYDYKDFFDKNCITFLKNNGCFDDSDNLFKKFVNNINKKRTQLDITISLTESCNLSCKYCSQSNVRSNSFITTDIIDEIIEYIRICLNDYGYKTVSIHLFGGEPLLCKKEIIYLNNKLKADGIIPYYYMDTNGLLLSEDFINEFDNITFCVTLSEKIDHDNLRVTTNKKGSYDIIFNNLLRIQDVIDKNHKLMIRYNVNDKNINYIEKFVDSVKNLKISDFVVAFTNNYKNNNYVNKLTYRKYKKWYSKNIIPLFVKYNFPISLPVSSYYCKGYDEYSLKIFSNGKVGMCNAFDINKSNYFLSDILNEYHKSKKIIKPFEESRKREKIIDKKCKKCKYLYICNGKFFCRDNECEFLDYNINDYIKSYVENVLNK